MWITLWIDMATAALWITIGYMIARMVDDYRENKSEAGKVWKPANRRS